MYEAEVNNSTESIETLPPDIGRRFAESRDRIATAQFSLAVNTAVPFAGSIDVPADPRKQMQNSTESDSAAS